MSTLRSLVIDIAANTARLSSDLGKAQHMLEGFGNNAKRILSIAAGGFVGREILEGINAVIEKGKEWEAANNRIVGILRATGSAAGITKTEIEEMAEGFSKSTLADDDAVKGIASTLLKFGNIQQDVFKRAVKDSLDLSAVMGNDFPGAAQKLGQALASPQLGLRGLQQEIGKLNPIQLQTITHFMEMGDAGKAQEEILRIVESRVSGLAAQMNTGLTKSTTDTTKAWDDFLKALARTQAVSGPSGFMKFVTDSLNDMKRILDDGDWVDKLKAIGLFAAGFRGMDIPKADVGNMGDTPGERARAQAAIDAAAERKTQEERDALLLENAQKTMGVLLAARRAYGQAGVAAQQAAGQREQEVLDLYQSQSLISISAFYETRQSIQRAGLERELAASTANIEQMKKNLGTPGLIQGDAARIGAMNELAAEMNKREQLQNRLAFVPVENTMKQSIANEQLADALKGVNLQLAQEEGYLANVAAGQFNLQNKMLFRQADRNSSSDVTSNGRADLEALRDRLVLNAQFQAQQVRSSAILDTLSAKEQSIETLRKSGAITDTEALRLTGSARAAQIDQLRNIADAYAEIARNMSGPSQETALAAVAQMRARIDDLAASVDLLGQRARTVFEDSFVNFLDAAIGRTKSLKQAVTDMVADISKQFLHLANQDVARMIFGKSGSSEGAGLGLGGIAGLLKLFGGGGSSTNMDAVIGSSSDAEMQSTVGGFEDFYGNLVGGSAGYAVGTDYVPRTGLALVHKGERITPADENNSDAQQGSGGVTIVQNMSFGSDVNVSTLAAWGRQIKTETMGAVADATRRGGTYGKSVRG